jgi:hypothetical protein
VILQVFAGADDATLLTYTLLPYPDPLRPGKRDASLTFVITNGGREVVTVGSIAVALPVGTSAKTLTADPNSIGSQVPDGWNATRDGGIVTLTPKTPAAAKLGAHSLTVVLTGINVNAEPGSCRISITESASSPSKPTPATRTRTLELAKFPESFWLGDLRLSAAVIRRGGSVAVAWAGSPATYQLEYDPDGGGTPTVVENVQSPYPATNLTAPSVVFTLTASITVPGSDQPLVAQRQATVSVGAASVKFEAFPLHVAANGLVKLSWECTGTASRTLSPGDQAVAPIGYAYVVVPKEQTFTLVAIENETKRRIVKTIDIRVDPLAPTETIEKRGKRGQDGVPARSGRVWGTDGDPGQSLGDFTITLGPLDTNWPPRRVVLLTTVGGKGGDGGDGTPGYGGKGGDGGSGGTATLQFDPDKPPQQVVIGDLASSANGVGGRGNPRGKDGVRGAPTQLRFVELPGTTE